MRLPVTCLKSGEDWYRGKLPDWTIQVDGTMKLLSTKQVSEILNLPESTLRYWRCAGLGPSYVKLGGRIKYDEADVHAYVKANKRIPSVRAAQENRLGTLSA
jgi:predicted DNA-binding transcriptional regulator AlpA